MQSEDGTMTNAEAWQWVADNQPFLQKQVNRLNADKAYGDHDDAMQEVAIQAFKHLARADPTEDPARIRGFVAIGLEFSFRSRRAYLRWEVRRPRTAVVSYDEAMSCVDPSQRNPLDVLMAREEAEDLLRRMRADHRATMRHEFLGGPVPASGPVRRPGLVCGHIRKRWAKRGAQGVDEVSTIY